MSPSPHPHNCNPSQNVSSTPFHSEVTAYSNTRSPPRLIALCSYPTKPESDCPLSLYKPVPWKLQSPCEGDTEGEAEAILRVLVYFHSTYFHKRALRFMTALENKKSQSEKDAALWSEERSGTSRR